MQFIDEAMKKACDGIGVHRNRERLIKIQSNEQNRAIDDQAKRRPKQKTLSSRRCAGKRKALFGKTRIVLPWLAR